MDSHLLFKLTYVLYRVRSAIIHDERWLVESSRKLCLFYPPCKGWLRNLAQRLFHNVNSYSFARKASAFPSVKMLFLDSLGGVLDLYLYIVSSSSLEETSELEGDRFCWAWQSCFFKSSISRCMALSSFRSWDTWPFLQKPLPPLWMVCTLPSW